MGAVMTCVIAPVFTFFLYSLYEVREWRQPDSNADVCIQYSGIHLYACILSRDIVGVPMGFSFPPAAWKKCFWRRISPCHKPRQHLRLKSPESFAPPPSHLADS